MAGYRQSRPDRAKAAVAAVAVHALIGAAFLTGLVTNVAKRADVGMKTFDVPPEVPPPPIEEPEVPEEAAPEKEAGLPNLKADPSPIVAPEPKLPIPSPLPAAPVAGTGSATTAGAAEVRGPGIGAGGSGAGRGGGGSGGGGGGTGYTPAQRISKIPDREYRRLKDMSGSRRGSVGVAVRVGPDGVPSNCRIARTSGNSAVDAYMCQLTLAYVRFRPARDPQGRAISQDVTWYPDWSPR